MTSTAPLAGQTVVVVGGSSGIGLATARHARAGGADVIITARDPARVHRAGLALGARIAAFDATDRARLDRFFAEMPTPIDHLVITGPAPDDAPSSMFDPAAVRRDVEAHLIMPLQVVGSAQRDMRTNGSVVMLGCTGRRPAARRLVLIAALSAALSSLTEELAAQLAPLRVNLIVSGFVEAPLDVGGAVAAADVAALAVHLMTNTALTASTYVVDGGQRFGVAPSRGEEAG
jgi:NAD(P)-dependent dehydrogenase (short-subunit alcohol dehydrogenase family)